MEELTKEQIVAMAIAAIAEETKTDAKNLRVVSFREVQKTPLMQYVSDNNINYKRYELEDELA
ncbi:MAG: hypothetical protein MJ166_08445 [Clostridia bacterium]|nr:hypothetical protein [Clostridia bacterium]